MKMALSKFFIFMASATVVLVSASASNNNGGGYEQPIFAKGERLLSTTIAIQGIIYYSFGSTTAPLQGGVTRITCKTVDKYGYEAASYSFLSDSTDANGYFLATLSPAEVNDGRELTGCRAFLELSPLETCQSPAELNNGVTGALLRSCGFLVNKKMKLFSIGPFLFTCQSLDSSMILPPN